MHTSGSEALFVQKAPKEAKSRNGVAVWVKQVLAVFFVFKVALVLVYQWQNEYFPSRQNLILTPCSPVGFQHNVIMSPPILCHSKTKTYESFCFGKCFFY